MLKIPEARGGGGGGGGGGIGGGGGGGGCGEGGGELLRKRRLGIASEAPSSDANAVDVESVVEGRWGGGSTGGGG